MAPSASRPTQFYGTTSGATWWRDFSKWLVESGSQANDAMAVDAFEAFMEGGAAQWFQTLSDSATSTLKTLKKEFLARYPGMADATGILDYGVEDPVETFRQFLTKGMGDKDLTAPVEVDIRGSGRFEAGPYFHQWIRMAYVKGSEVPSQEMSATVQGTMLRDALPKEVRQMIPKQPKMTLADIARAVLAIDPADLNEVISDRNRLLRLEQRGIARYQQQNAAPTMPSIYAPMAPAAVPSASSRGPNAPGVGPVVPQPGAPAVRGEAHLTFPNTQAGRDAYAKALAAYNATYGTGGAVSASRPLPLTPGTLAPGPNVCDLCGLAGHLRTACNNTPLDEREARFRGINSSAQRAENMRSREQHTAVAPVRSVGFGDLTPFNPADWYFEDSESENEAGQA